MKPDCQRIAELERELGVSRAECDLPNRQARTVCLIKNCTGETTEIRTWQGSLIRRIHNH